MTVALSPAEGALAAARLTTETDAAELNWTIVYADSPGEPHAFRLTAEGAAAVEPPQVIGETEEQALACIHMAIHLSRQLRRKRQKKGLPA